jgi:1-acyl-sn-glycerol-3-phosphate acyltransferase
VACLRAGNQLLMFPEGTRTRKKSSCRFKGGYALIAKTAGVPVQTVFIETNSKFLGKGWPLYRKPAFPLIYRVRLGQRFEVDGEVKSAVSAMERYHCDAMASPRPAESGPPREMSAA